MSSQKRARTFKVLSALLSYPSEELKAATEELRQVLRSEGLVTGGQLKRVEAFLAELGNSVDISFHRHVALRA